VHPIVCLPSVCLLTGKLLGPPVLVIDALVTVVVSACSASAIWFGKNLS
jgi:hypothetical protein